MSSFIDGNRSKGVKGLADRFNQMAVTGHAANAVPTRGRPVSNQNVKIALSTLRKETAPMAAKLVHKLDVTRVEGIQMFKVGLPPKSVQSTKQTSASVGMKQEGTIKEVHGRELVHPKRPCIKGRRAPATIAFAPPVNTSQSKTNDFLCTTNSSQEYTAPVHAVATGKSRKCCFLALCLTTLTAITTVACAVLFTQK